MRSCSFHVSMDRLLPRKFLPIREGEASPAFASALFLQGKIRISAYNKHENELLTEAFHYALMYDRWVFTMEQIEAQRSELIYRLSKL